MDWSSDAVRRRKIKEKELILAGGKPVERRNEKVSLSMPEGPRFSVYTRKDAVWSSRVL